MRNRLILAMAMTAVSAMTAQAQKVDTLAPTKVTEKVIRGTATTPITQTQLDKNTLNDRSFGQEMTYMLSTTPSITSVSDNGAYNSYTYMRLRGLDQPRINMTLNGVPLNEPEDQGVYFSNFPDFASSVQSVQVQRGVGTSSNGTASYVGSVNFQSINPFEQHRGVEYWYNMWTAADWTQTFNSTGVYVRHTKQDVTGYRDHSGNASQSTYLSSLSLYDHASLRLTGFTGTSNNDMAYLASPLSVIKTNPMDNPLSPDEKDHFKQNFVSAEYTTKFSQHINTSVTGYWITLQGHYGVKMSPEEMDDFSVMSGWVGAFNNWQYTSDKLRVDLGIHANNYKRDHFMYTPTVQAYRNYGMKDEESMFLKADYALTPMLNVVADVQNRNTSFSYHPDQNAGITEQSIRWTFVNPKVGLTFKPSENVKTYATFGTNTREPSRNDMFAGFDNLDTSNVEFIGSFHRVKPETVRDLEAGIEAQSQNAAIHVNVFNMNFYNEIAPIGKLSYIGLPLRKNVDRSYRRGLEVEGSVKVLPSLTASANATLSHNRIKTYTDDASGITYSNVRPLLTPEVLANQQLTYQVINGVTLFWFGRYVGKSQLDNTDNAAFVTPAFFLHDAALSANVGPVAVNLRINNLANKKDAYFGGYTDGAEPYYFVGIARNLNLGIRYNF